MRLSTPSDAGRVDLSGLDLLSSRFYATGDPHAVWHYLRRHRPVYRHEPPGRQPFWLVTRYDDVCRVLRDHQEFTSRHGTMLSIVDLAMPDIASDQMMPDTDPPRHTELREPLARALTVRAIEAQEPRIREIVDRLLEPAMAEEPWDFAAAALLFPMAFTGTLMGIPPGDWPRMSRLTTMTIAYDDPEFAEGPPKATLIQAHHELFGFFAAEIRRRGREAEPRDDLLGILSRMAFDGRSLSGEQVLFNCYSLLLGANVTTPHAASVTLMQMADDPDQYARWAGDPGLLESGVEEGLRWASPASHFMRYAVGDVELRGVRIPAGEPVTAWLGSANRDESAFPDPYRFDVGRSPNRHVAFGYGPHYCIGGHLARSALRVLFGEVLRRFERIEVVGPVEHLASNFVAGVKHLPVRMTRRPGV